MFTREKVEMNIPHVVLIKGFDEKGWKVSGFESFKFSPQKRRLNRAFSINKIKKYLNENPGSLDKVYSAAPLPGHVELSSSTSTTPVSNTSTSSDPGKAVLL